MSGLWLVAAHCSNDRGLSKAAFVILQQPGVPQPRPQGLLAFQYGGGSGEDPGTQQITCLQRGWRCIQNGG